MDGWMDNRGIQWLLSEQFQIVFNKFRTKGCLKASDSSVVCVYVNQIQIIMSFFFQKEHQQDTTRDHTAVCVVIPIRALISKIDFFFFFYYR